MPSARLVATALEVAHLKARGEPTADVLIDQTWRLLHPDAGAGLVTYRRRDGQIAEVDVAVAGALPVPAEIAQRARTLAPQHPGIAQLVAAGTAEPVRVSDVVRLRSFWGTELYEYMHGFNGGRYPMAAALLMNADEVVYLALHQRERDFRDEDVADLQALQRVVAPAYCFRAALDTAVAYLENLSAARQPLPQFAPNLGGQLSVAAELCREFRPTRREAEVLTLVSAGLTDKQIARRLGVSHRTVRKHLTEVFEKTGTRGRAAAAVYWQHHRQ